MDGEAIRRRVAGEARVRSRLPGGDLPERRKRWTSGDSLGEVPFIIWRLPEPVGVASCYRRSNQVIPGVLDLRQRGGSQPRIRSCPRSPNSREMMDGTFFAIAQIREQGDALSGERGNRTQAGGNRLPS